MSYISREKLASAVHIQKKGNSQLLPKEKLEEDDVIHNENVAKIYVPNHCGLFDISIGWFFHLINSAYRICLHNISLLNLVPFA